MERTHRIGETKTRGDTRPIIVKFFQYNNQNRVFRNKKGLYILITKSLMKIRMDKLRQAKETNVWTNDGKILFKSDSNTEQ